MKVKQLVLTVDEAKLMNNVLVENCMNMVEVMNSASSPEDAQNSVKLVQSSVLAQQTLFAQTVGGTYEFGEGLLDYLKSITEACTCCCVGKVSKMPQSDSIIPYFGNIALITSILHQ